MANGKIDIEDADDATTLGNIRGIGPASFTALGLSGYRVHRNTTVSQFKTLTGSYEAMKNKMDTHETKYVLPKFRSLWQSNDHKNGGNNKRPTVAEEPDNPAKAMIGAKAKSHEDITMDERKGSFLMDHLGAKDEGGGPDTSSNPDIVTNVNETPGVAVMERSAEDAAISEGDIAGKVQMSVIPDQVLVLAPSAQEINAPLKVLPEDLVPILPAIAIGDHVAGSRMVDPLSHQEQMVAMSAAEDLPSVKANGTRDIGEDGVGAASHTKLPGTDKAPPGTTAKGGSKPQAGGANSKFKMVDYKHKGTTGSEGKEGGATVPTDPSKAEDQAPKPQEESVHPFKQPSLFRNHDMAAKTAHAIYRTKRNRDKLAMAEAELTLARDGSWRRWNAATEGVQSMEMGPLANNFLTTGFVSEFQMDGSLGLRDTFSIAPYYAESTLGRFGQR